jgi:hypothetical protein
VSPVLLLSLAHQSGRTVVHLNERSFPFLLFTVWSVGGGQYGSIRRLVTGGLWHLAGDRLLELVTVIRFRLAVGMWWVAECRCGLHSLVESGGRRKVVH